jgi:hypothetical protein
VQEGQGHVGKGHVCKGLASHGQPALHAVIAELAAKVAASAPRDRSVPQQAPRGEGCRKDFFYDESRTAPTKQRGAARYAPLICKVLQKMQPTLRRKVISGRLTQSQRVALETCMASQKQSPSKVHPPVPSKVIESDTQAAESRDAEKTNKQRKYGGVFRSECKGAVYGYYAKAGLCNLTFTARIHRDLTGAVQDHVALCKLLEQIQTQRPLANFPAAVKSAVEAASGVNGFLSPGFFRNFSVSFPTERWIGHMLFVHCQCMEGALHVWKLLDAFKDFTGLAGIGPENHMERAEQQWDKVHSVLEALQSGFGKFHSTQLGTVLQENTARRSTVLGRLVATLERQQQKHLRNLSVRAKLDQAALLRRFEDLRRSWHRAVAKQDQCKQRLQLRESRKRRWDGKESKEEFQRRLPSGKGY